MALSRQVTSGRGGLGLWKCLYLSRNVTKGNNVLSQSTLMDLPTISPESPLTGETTESSTTLAGPGASAVCCHTTPTLHPLTLTSDPSIDSYRSSASLTCLISSAIVRFHAKGLHLKCTFYADNTTAQLNAPSGCVCMSVM